MPELDDYILDDEDTNELYDENYVQSAIIQALDVISSLIKQTQNNLFCGQKTLYEKGIVYIKLLITKLSELQELEKQINSGESTLRPSDIINKVDEIMNNVKEYEMNKSNPLDSRIQKLSENSQTDDNEDYLNLLW